MTLIFQNPFFTLYIILVWVHIFVETRALIPVLNRYFFRHLRDPDTTDIIAGTSELVSYTGCGSSYILILLTLFPLFTLFLGSPDLVDFVVAFGGAAVIGILTFTRTWSRNRSEDS